MIATMMTAAPSKTRAGTKYAPMPFKLHFPSLRVAFGSWHLTQVASAPEPVHSAHEVIKSVQGRHFSSFRIKPVWHSSQTLSFSAWGLHLRQEAVVLEQLLHWPSLTKVPLRQLRHFGVVRVLSHSKHDSSAPAQLRHFPLRLKWSAAQTSHFKPFSSSSFEHSLQFSSACGQEVHFDPSKIWVFGRHLVQDVLCPSHSAQFKSHLGQSCSLLKCPATHWLVSDSLHLEALEHWVHPRPSGQTVHKFPFSLESMK